MNWKIKLDNIGAVALTLSHKKWYKRSPFETLLYLSQLLIINKKYNILPKDIKKLAARVTHVRICVGNDLYFSQNAPIAKIDNYTREQLISWGRVYRDPTFTPTRCQEIALYMKADDLCKDVKRRRYDYLQLLSYGVNLLLWYMKPSWWGKEVIKTFNLPGGRGVCSSTNADLLRETFEREFFEGYDTAMVFPFLVLISSNWSTDANSIQ